ncbi:carbohydrate ABC transporter permease [Paenibacillus cymbidii]|uniref:carbohydrate ABC transporter permease n=1 Tax=Paenibacillus cymbidii TaxID=1639034 RepID=UPI001081B4EB|nr:carbohydrate ABC transporter permease [Paenibacillus cymbidii]
MKESLGEKIYMQLIYVLLIVLAILCLAPLLHIISLSLSSKTAIETGQVVLWPVDLDTASYRLLFQGTRIGSAFVNSVQLTVVGVLLCMVMTIGTAYPLSRGYFAGRRFYTLAMIFTMLFSGGLVPTYLVVKSLGLINTYYALWLPNLVSTFNVLIMKTYFENLSKEVEEAALIDGCGEYRLIGRIVLPLSMPVIATLALFYGVGFWNAFMSVLIYINSSAKYTLTVLVQQMIQSQSLLVEQMRMDGVEQSLPDSIKSAAVIVMVLPMLVVYPFLQKYFVKGVMLGSVKG